MHAACGNSRFAFWRRTAGALAVLAIAAQGAPLLACAPHTPDAKPGCDIAMDAPAHAEPTHLEHSGAPLDAPDAQSSGTSCGHDGMTGECLQQCVTVAVASAPDADRVRVAPRSPADQPVAHLIGIPPTADSPPPKG